MPDSAEIYVHGSGKEKMHWEVSKSVEAGNDILDFAGAAELASVAAQCTHQVLHPLHYQTIFKRIEESTGYFLSPITTELADWRHVPTT